MRVGVIGNGIIGGTLTKYLLAREHEVKIIDKLQKRDDSFKGVEMVFISVPIHTNDDGTLDFKDIEDALQKTAKLPIDTPVFLRSTALPGTADSYKFQYNRQIIAMPEFLTQRRAFDDFCKLPIIVGLMSSNALVHDKFHSLFSSHKIVSMRNSEAELAKYTHNVFGALKVHYWNEIADLCKELSIDFKEVRQGALCSGLINQEHTLVPGPDGTVGFGGKCLPKDTKAFGKFLAKKKFNFLGIDFGALLFANDLRREQEGKSGEVSREHNYEQTPASIER